MHFEGSLLERQVRRGWKNALSTFSKPIDPSGVNCSVQQSVLLTEGFAAVYDREGDNVVHQAVVIGAGPAGLTAAYELTKHNVEPVVIEKYDKVGGIARTEDFNGYRFDMGGHRFFSKSKEVNQMWAEVLGNEFLRRPRTSRIYYKQKFFDYPLKPFGAFFGLGLLQSILIVVSYIRWQLFPYKQEETYEQWVTNRFGKRLFLTFFKTYTEKVWGIPCSELKAEWAAQRIKDLSLKTAVLSMFKRSKKTIKSLITEFNYPRLGPGMMWNSVKDRVEARGGSVLLNTEVVQICRSGLHVDSVVVTGKGGLEHIVGANFISSMPVRELIEKLDPPAPPDVLEAAKSLHYRDFLTVCLVINRPHLFPDNWIYIHDPNVLVGRIQNFKNWSPDMVPDSSKSSLGMEYFCTEGDELWNTPDRDLIERAKCEIEHTGLARYADVEAACVFRVEKSYPIYDADYRNYLGVVRQFVDSLENLQTIGRNGLHRYNNQDHAMLTGMMAVRNLVYREKNDIWAVNEDKDYHEEVTALEVAIQRAFTKLDRLALGLSFGAACGSVVFLATLFLVLKGGPVVGPTLQLLDQFFPLYSVTLGGSLLGLGYGFLVGFLGGWGFAFIRNMSLFLMFAAVRRGAELQALRRVLDYI